MRQKRNIPYIREERRREERREEKDRGIEKKRRK
jgi:hypothetical protein